MIRRLTVLVTLAALTACSTPEFDGPVALVTTDPHGGDAALLQGAVDLGEGCLVTVTSDGTRWLPVFYSGAVSSEDDELRWDGRSYSSGDAIELGGGGSMDTDPSRADYVPSGCEFDGMWFVATSSTSNPESSSRNAA